MRLAPIRHFSNFMDHIRFDWDTECCNWKMSKLKDGYGRCGYHGRLYLAHRLAKHLFGDMTWEQLHDPKIVVMHTCDNPACVNPSHLRLGTQQENIADRKRKKRSASHLGNRDDAGRFKSKSV